MRDVNLDRKGDWIQTFSGLPFWVLDPRPEDIRIEDIAHALSLQTRYGGHCQRFYSIAEHAVLLSYLCSPELAFEMLNHDDEEAYMGDIPRPIKWMFPELKKAGENIQKVICQKFGISWPLNPELKKLDDAIIASERNQNMAPSLLVWSEGGDALVKVMLFCWLPMQAEAMFLKRFRELSK